MLKIVSIFNLVNLWVPQGHLEKTSNEHWFDFKFLKTFQNFKSFSEKDLVERDQLAEFKYKITLQTFH